MPTPTQYAQDFLAGVRGRLSAAAAARINLTEGSKWDALAGGIARVMTRLDSVEAAAFDAHVLERAVGPDLDTYCANHGPVRRLGAAAAHGPLTLARAGFTAGAGAVYAGTVVSVPFNGTSQLFTVDVDTPVGATSLSVSVDVTASTPGLASSVGSVSGGLRLTGQPAPLWDATLLPTAINAVGGVDEEKDPELRARQRAYEQGRHGGTIDAVRFAALSVPGVKHVVLASRYAWGSGGEGVCYIGDANWQSNDALISAVAVALESARAFGPGVNVRGMVTAPVTCAAVVTMARAIVNYDQVRLRALITQRVTDYFSTRVDPFAWSGTILAGRITHADDDIVAVVGGTTVGGSPSSGATSPLTTAALLVSGGFPASLIVYTTDPSLVSVQLAGTT